MREIQEKIRKSEKGSVTLFVLVSMMFTTMFLLFAYTSQTNRISDQKKQIAEIQRKYNTGNMEDIYNQMQTKEPQNGEIILRKANGEIYSIKDWTNEDLTLEIPYPDEIQDKYYYLDDKRISYQEGQKITGNCTIKVEYENYRAEVQVSKIDKVLPTVELGINGGTGYTMPSSGNATIKTTITANDLGGSKLATLQYAWSNSNTTEPSAWKDFTNGSEVIKTDITLAGNYYLWTKVMDGAGNRAETVKTSNAFVVSANTITENKIVLTPNPSTWTNSTVTVTANYGVNLTENRTITCTGTETIDYTRNGNDSVTVNTNGQTVTATATDIAGNKVIKTLTIENIDITKPTVNVEAQDITSDSAKLVVTATDTGSGIPLEKAYSYYLDGNLKATVDSAEYTYTGLPSGTECVLKVVVVDKAGNDAEATTKITTETSSGPFIPAGATIDPEHNDIEKGFVIKDENQNEWVWIEVPKSIYEDPAYNGGITPNKTDYTKIETILQEYTKDYKVASKDVFRSTTQHGFLSSTDYNAHKQSMLKSIYENGGFYIGRYEVGATTAVTKSDNGARPPLIRQDLYPYNFVTCKKAQELTSQLKTGGRTCSLMFGIQWNLVMKYIESKGAKTQAQLKSNSGTWGNYYDMSFTVTRGRCATYNTSTRKLGAWSSPITSLNKATNKSMIFTTGATERNSVLNIYDLAGNLYEWTLATPDSSSYNGVFRGGDYRSMMSTGAPAYRQNTGSTTTLDDKIGFRVALW